MSTHRRRVGHFSPSPMKHTDNYITPQAEKSQNITKITSGEFNETSPVNDKRCMSPGAVQRNGTNSNRLCDLDIYDKEGRNSGGKALK